MWRRAAWILVSLVGLFGGHWAAFALAAPRLAANHKLLETTGHHSVVPNVIAAILVGGLSSWLAGRPDAGRSTVLRLALLQALAFSGLEIYERTTMGSVASLLTDPVFHLGFVLQLVTAALGAALLFAGKRLVAKARRASTAIVPVKARVATLLPAFVHTPHFDLDRSWSRRGPPALLSLS